MKIWLSEFTDRYFNPSLDLRVQAFNLLAHAGIAAGLIAALVSSITGVYINIFICLLASALAFFLVRYARKTNRYRFCYRLTVILVFMLAFPFMFFTVGGYKSGMLCYFVFALVFTALMLEGRDRVVALACEFFIYTGVCVVAWLRPDSVNSFKSETAFAIDAITSFIASSAILLSVILLYIRIYNNRQERLEELDKLKTEFYRDMHHEMKSPLHVISTDIQNADDMLDFDIDKSVIRAKLESAQQEIIRLARMVENSLDLAAAEVNRKHMQQIDFASLLRSKAEIFRSLLEREGNTLIFEIPDNLPSLPSLPSLTGNADMLSQVIFNLMYNACRHTKDGSVTVSLSRTSNLLSACIRDTGEGIPPHILPRVFERGVSSNGTGYGLFICKAILEMHGGDIHVESELGAGTAVTFTLPTRKSGGGVFVSNRGTILLVDDDARVQTNNKEILERRGYAVLLATDLSQAREAVTERPIDAVVLDIFLPDGDGVDFLKELRQTLQIPVLMLTAAQAPEKAASSFDAGGDDYLRKPYDLKEFRARVDALIRRASRLPETIVKGPLKLNIVSNRAFLKGRDMLLTQKEFSLLACFVQNEDRTMSAEYLYEKAWDAPTRGYKKTLQKHISALRKKLEDENSGYTVNAVYRQGYCFEKT